MCVSCPNYLPKYLVYVFTALLLVSMASGVQAFDFRGGGVLEDGASEHRLSVERRTWTQQERGEDLLIATPAARYGVAPGYDVQIGLPIRQQGETRDLHALDFTLGFPLSGSPHESGYVTLTAQGRLLPTTKPVGSGDKGASLGLHIGNRLGQSRAHLDGYLGLERGDAAVPDGAGYQAVNRLRYASRIEQPLGQSLALSAEVEAFIGLSGAEVQNQFALNFRPGIRWSPTPHSDIRLVYGSDVVESGIAPQSTVQLSFVYTPEPQSSRRSLTERIEHLEAENRSLKQRTERLSVQSRELRRDTDSLDERLTDKAEELRQGVSALQATQSLHGNRIAENRQAIEGLERRTGALHIEVINRSGSRQLANDLIARLQRQGHQVVRRIEATDREPRASTAIHYRKGFSQAATNLSANLPGEQQVNVADPEIPRGANVRIILGAEFPGAEDDEE